LELLSRDCDGCSQQRACRVRYNKVEKGERVYCADGTAHLVDQETVTMFVTLPEIIKTET
jgi:hypothetical protein